MKIVLNVLPVCAGIKHNDITMQELQSYEHIKTFYSEEKVPTRNVGYFYTIKKIDIARVSSPALSSDEIIFDISHKRLMAKKWELLQRIDARERLSL